MAVYSVLKYDMAFTIKLVFNHVTSIQLLLCRKNDNFWGSHCSISLFVKIIRFAPSLVKNKHVDILCLQETCIIKENLIEWKRQIKYNYFASNHSKGSIGTGSR